MVNIRFRFGLLYVIVPLKGATFNLAAIIVSSLSIAFSIAALS